MVIELFRCLAFAIVSAGVVLGDAKADKPTGSPPLAPGYNALKFAAPVPGTYRLPVLGSAADGQVLDSEGTPTTLHALFGNSRQPPAVVLLSFIYSTCSDVNGCPLATAVLHKLKNRLVKETALAKQVRLITLSFNPGYDTPARMKAFGASLQSEQLDWRFLTTASEHDLQPILAGYRQTADKIYDAEGKFTNTFNHNLRVFLIDQHKQVRNIYNTELLHPDLLVSDILTLLQAENGRVPQPAGSGGSARIDGAGDYKTGYEDNTYHTDSVSLEHRQGKPVELLKTVQRPPLGLPPVPVPSDNPIASAKISLGRKLFYDRRLSINNTFSCAMCHIPEQGFTSNEMATAVGVEGRTVRRNSPTLYNVAYQRSLFHDSRESTLEQQVWGPLLAVNEMGNPSVGYVIDKIKRNKEYQGLFETAFAKPPGMETIGMAIASYERALISANSPFDRWYYGKDEQAIGRDAKLGFALFTGKAGCNGCHTLEKNSALLTDHDVHNTGVGYAAAMLSAPEKSLRVQLAPGIYTDVAHATVDSVSDKKANDLGRYEVTQQPQDRWRYKTPSLRNIALTAPYMHDGSLATLKDVVEFYNRGGISNENIDPRIKPLTLSAKEVEALLAFMQTLTGDNIKALVGDAFAAPVGDSH